MEHFRLLLLLLAIVPFCAGQLPVCGNVVLNASLVATFAYPVSHTSVAYNNFDTIYIFGGLQGTGAGTKMNQILSYRISQPATPTQVATMPTARYAGITLTDGTLATKFVYLGVDDDGSPTDPVYLFNPSGNAITTIGQTQTITEKLAAVETGSSSQALVFGGPEYEWNNVTQIDMRYGNNSIIGSLPLGLAARGTAVRDYTTGNITVIGAGLMDTYLNTRIMYVNPNNMSDSYLKPSVADLPDLDRHAAAYDYDKGRLWVVGGYNDLGDVPTEGIYSVDMSDLGVDFVPVNGFPNYDDMWLSASSAVYIQGRWQLLFFGGLMKNSSIPDDPGTRVNSIWQIDLTPYYCCTKPDGNYAHPNDCSKFITCSNKLTNVLQCPAPLYWDPVLKICNFVNLVSCALEQLLEPPAGR